MQTKIDPCDTMRNNLIAAAVGLQKCTKTAANLVPLPGTEKYVAIGTAAGVSRLLATQAAKEPVADERALFEAWIKTRLGYPFAGTFMNLMWDAWQARAAHPAAAVEPTFAESDIPADAPRAFAKRYSALLEENIKLKAKLAEAAPVEPVAIPAGYALVPLDPTPEMKAAFMREYKNSAATALSVYKAIVAAAPSPAPAALKADMADAYVGAREDMAIWKKRALEAEESCRHLTAALNAENGPTLMGEPAIRAASESAGAAEAMTGQAEPKGDAQ